jgi:agmatinase
MSFFDFGQFIESDTEFVIFGIPWDYLTSISLPNSAIAPDKIREVTRDIALGTELGFEIPNFKAVDLGDVKIEAMNVQKNIEEITNIIINAYNQNKKIVPIMIGGDHFCSYPVIKAVGDQFEKKKEFGIVIFDSHLDFYEKWDKGVYSHATISHRVYDLEYVNNKNLLIVGTRDMDLPELEIMANEQVEHFDAYKLIDLGLDNYIKHIVAFFKKSNINYIYISIDVDVLDPSIAPGTGFAIPGGFSYREMWKILRELAIHFKIIGFDIVEVAPNLDNPNRVTCNLAAKLIVELMSFIVNKK